MGLPVTLLRFIWLSTSLVNKMGITELPAEIKLKEHSVPIPFSKHWQGLAMTLNHMKRICILQAETRTQSDFSFAYHRLIVLFVLLWAKWTATATTNKTTRKQTKNCLLWQRDKVFSKYLFCLNLFTLNSLICSNWNVYF